ncbi:hypothetical protein DIPPA_05612 [Diplonema papillatum]|nr:hypothetical protein DIPPA_05612 [Diplonema papillatum]
MNLATCFVCCSCSFLLVLVCLLQLCAAAIHVSVLEISLPLLLLQKALNLAKSILCLRSLLLLHRQTTASHFYSSLGFGNHHLKLSLVVFSAVDLIDAVVERSTRPLSLVVVCRELCLCWEKDVANLYAETRKVDERH